jgi:uncharacterized ferritin-like protein (DUF455 family)
MAAQKQQLELDSVIKLDAAGYDIPGRPNKPILVDPTSVKRRAMHTVEGRAILIHALAHIEFNAINLALDAIWRFDGMPEAYYWDWLKIADDFPAHNGLWDMVERTQHSILARMALVPRTLEARGLDALPPIMERLEQVKDQAAIEILNIIYRDEIGHVEIGNRWFHYCCQQQNREPIATYQNLSEEFRAPKLKGPLNVKARMAAGFTQAELDALSAQVS